MISREIEFFNNIKHECNIIFDVGTRNDTAYIDNSSNKEIHLFEPNPIFFKELKENIKNTNGHKLFLNNFGLSNFTGNLKYYSDSQSFLKRFIHFKSVSEPILLPVKSFSQYILENNVDHIDFLKMDVEGCEPDILLNGINFIYNKVYVIQFEYASTWLDRDDRIDLSNIYNIYSNGFNFVFLYSDNNPLHDLNPNLITYISQEHIPTIERVMRSQYGFEIIMLRKNNDHI